MLDKSLVAILGCGLMTFGCAVDPELDTHAEDTKEIIGNLIAAGFPGDDIQIYDGIVYVGNDAEVSLTASREMLEGIEGEFKQYRTNNLVSSSMATICVNGAAYTGTLSSALDMAIDNYNALGLSFSMTRTSRRKSPGCDATITAKVASGVGGSSGFPKGGKPYGTINVGSGTTAYGVNTTEHVITHELGHCVGLRHSDYYDRSISCGVGGNEGSAGVGAIHIPGTPTGATVGGSVMNSCFRSNETGEFTNTDRTALQTLY